MTNQQGAPEAPRGTAADGKTELFNVTGYPLMVRAVDFNRLHAENQRLAALAKAQQPAPSAASKAVLAAIRAANMQLVRTGDDEFMLVTYKNAKAQCDGGKCGIGGYCDDCPTPQADSQPAMTPETVYAAIAHGDEEHRAWLLSALRAVWCGEAVPPVASPIADAAAESQPEPVREHDLQDVRCECCGYMTYHLEHMGCIRAARAPADSVTAPAGGAVMEPTPVTDADVRDMSARVISGQAEEDELVAFFERLAPPRPVRITHEEDSVLEDAARYRWLFGARTDAQTMSVSETVFTPLPQDEVLSHLQGFYMSKAVVDALVDAARKKGGA